jgi:hypothetical protein
VQPGLVLLPPITSAYPSDRVLAAVADELRRQGFRRVRVAPDSVEFAQPPFFTHSRAPAVGGGVCRLAGAGAGADRWVRLDLRFDHPGFLFWGLAAALFVVAVPLGPALRALALGALAAALTGGCRASAWGMRAQIAAAVRRAP